MFTVKYRFFEPAVTPADCTSPGFTPVERVDGPYVSVSSRYESGHLVVTADHGTNDTPGMTYGPILSGPDQLNYPRPTVWVMNANGATVATYHL